MPRQHTTNNKEYAANRRRLLAEHPECHWCGKEATEADHLIAYVDGGENDPSNLVSACKSCNAKRGAQLKNKRNAQQQQQRKKILDSKTKSENNFENVFLLEKSSPRAPRFPLSKANQSAATGTGQAQPRLESPAHDAAGSFGPEVGVWAKAHLDIDLMPWQLHCLNGQLAHDEQGDLLNRVSLTSTARQAGKSTALAALVGWWLTEMPKIRGKKQMVLTTANRLDLAVTLFDLLGDVLEIKFGAKLTKAYGRNAVQMPDGSRWIVRAAKPNVGHGTSNDLIVADEIWDISEEAIDGGLIPSQRARRSPLLSMWSTAGTESSTVMKRWREQGLRAIDTGKTSTFYLAEWSPDPSLDVNLESTWAWGNPALGYTLTMDTLRSESLNPNRAQFLRASCNLWVASDQGWIPPGMWPQLEHKEPIPDGGYLGIEVSLDDSRYFGVRSVQLADRRVAVTVAFVSDTYSAMLEEVTKLAATNVKFLISPSIEIHWPTQYDQRTEVVGYGEIVRYTAGVKNMIFEGMLVHDGSKQLSEHVQRAVAVKAESSIALSSARSPGEISLARCMVWTAAHASRPTIVGKPIIAFSNR
ncbi:HNHc domain containing protein [uncultured Caudovirales phage]|uniref:HNHc domain containing protein n=1 Tax=uncultured Caudovirales phage TaxID=2100421 RepID=A0A6J5MK82_9CAUD|nr:HNHc domain containing protein [uncultured Caudovirales phage]